MTTQSQRKGRHATSVHRANKNKTPRRSQPGIKAWLAELRTSRIPRSPTIVSSLSGSPSRNSLRAAALAAEYSSASEAVVFPYEMLYRSVLLNNEVS